MDDIQQAPERLQWTPELVQRFWDQMSQNPDVYFTNQFGDRIIETVLQDLPQTGEILDFGCGTGFLTEHLLNAGHAVTGLDFSPATVTGVNERLGGHPAFRGAFEPNDLVGTGRSFDTIFCCEVIEHLYDEDLASAIDLMTQLLRPGGVLVVTTPNDENLSASEVYCPVSNVIFHRWQHVRSWNRDTLSGWLRANGLAPQTVAETDFSAGWQTDAVAQILLVKKRLQRRHRELPHLYAVARLDASAEDSRETQ